MNYALDALWWRLTDSDVRALAAVLTAPALWHSGSELPVAALLGERGFRFLLELDGSPKPLHSHLAQETPFGGRLGLYAESLLAFWLQHAPHCRLLARNLTVSDGPNTLGALDFVAEIGSRLYHIELCCKYYGTDKAAMDGLCGLNPHDRWPDKADKLTRQLALAHSEAGVRALAAAGIGHTAALHSASIVRGMLFAPSESRLPEPLNIYGWHGVFLHEWPSESPWGDECRYYLLPRTAYLLPARVAEGETLPWDEIRTLDSGLVAVLQRRPDGMWHESERVMKR